MITPTDVKWPENLNAGYITALQDQSLYINKGTVNVSLQTQAFFPQKTLLIAIKTKEDFNK